MLQREWEFRVIAKTLPGESVGVVGNCQELGHWYPQGALILNKDPNIINECGTWIGKTNLPRNEQIHYRYFICIILESSDGKAEKNVIMRRWETNLKPRSIHANADSNNYQNDFLDVFGTYEGETKVDRGWLTKETVIQLKLFNDPIQIWKQSLKGKLFQIKVTPVDLEPPTNSDMLTSSIEESWDVQDVRNTVKVWPIVEVAAMNEKDCEFHLQEQFGKLLEPGGCLIFQAQIMNPEKVTFLVDFYAYNPQTLDAPEHIGFCYILQSNMKDSEGSATVPITSPKHQPIGQMKIEYLIVKPVNDFQCDMAVSYSRHWKHTWRGLEVGHRGAGSSFKEQLKSCASIRENTIASLTYAANHGADIVEFDVQLSKDLVPVIYHDFHICIAMKKKINKGIDEHDLLQLPVKELTLAQLQMLKVYHLKEGNIGKFNDEEFDDHQPFPTLQHALEHIDPHVGFNIEIKWTMQLKDGTYELYHPFELNMYLDTMIKPVLKYGGSRKIVFSCFHPDICTMLRLKQNKYPVLFLTQGITKKYPDYHDPRTRNIPMAVYFALSVGILGINVHSEDLLRDPSQVALVHNKGLILFCWGEDNNDQMTIRYLKNLGLDGIIYDKIDVYTLKETKESIFLVEAREQQQQLLNVASSTQNLTQVTSSPPQPIHRFPIN